MRKKYPHVHNDKISKYSCVSSFMGITFFRSFSFLTERKGINGAKQVLGPKKKQTPKCNTPQKNPAITKKIAALHKIF